MIWPWRQAWPPRLWITQKVSKCWLEIQDKANLAIVTKNTFITFSAGTKESVFWRISPSIFKSWSSFKLLTCMRRYCGKYRACPSQLSPANIQEVGKAGSLQDTLQTLDSWYKVGSQLGPQAGMSRSDTSDIYHLVIAPLLIYIASTSMISGLTIRREAALRRSYLKDTSTSYCCLGLSNRLH